jgi:hypothetical protein
LPNQEEDDSLAKAQPTRTKPDIDFNVDDEEDEAVSSIVKNPVKTTQDLDYDEEEYDEEEDTFSTQ